MMYNLTEAKKQLIRTGAYLATSMGWNDEAPPTEKQVERWRESAMTLLNQQKAAHKEISTMRAEIDALKGINYTKGTEIIILQKELYKRKQEKE